MNDFYVYAWLRPCGTPFYIGKGRGPRAQSRKRNIIFTRIIEKIERHGLKAVVAKLYENLTEEKAFELERSEISRLGRINNGTGILANMTDGGEGGSGAVLSDEHRAKTSASLSGIVRTQLTRSKMSAARKGIALSDEHRAKLGEARRGKTLSEHHRKKMGDAIRLAPPTSGYKGVLFIPSSGRWRARITTGGKHRHICVSSTPELAALAYDRAAFEAWGADCYLNFPAAMTASQENGINERL